MPHSEPFLQPTTYNLAGRSAEVDRSVLRAFERVQPPATLVAVGGYGRRELFPFSDVDLLLLVDGPPGTAAREAISEFLRILWDAGLRVSQSVHTAAECCEIHEGNLELTISLLDQRFLSGDGNRYRDLQARFPQFLNAQKSTIATHLSRMTRGRHAKYGDTIYHLEPNVKEHPGGLRDIHVMHWLEKLDARGAESFETERDFLFQVRIFLHRHFQRDNNLLSFDAQEAISEDPANWMRQYYRNAREIYRAVTRTIEISEGATNSLLSQFRDWRGRVSNAEFTVSRERVLLREPQKLHSDPQIVMRLMQFVARHQLRLAWETERRVRAAGAEAVTRAASWDHLRELLALPRCSLALRAMQETAVLPAFIPEWQRIDCLVVRDFYHRYTVDEHTLVAIQSLEERHEDELRRRFAGLMSEIDHPELLRLALLLHDIGKGGGRGEHVAESVSIAASAMHHLGVPEDAARVVRFLIEHHLDLSSVMNSRDLGDPATARYIAERAGTIEQLKLLTLLTYADISAVNPAAMTPWRLEQLWRTYLAGYEELTRELETERIHAPQLPADLAWFVEGFPTRYLRTQSEADIRRHCALSEEIKTAAAAIDLVRLNGAWRMTLIAPDRLSLLASVSGALASFGMNILKAEAFANSHSIALETFTFSDPHRTLELNPSESDRLRDTVLRVLEGKADISRLLDNRRKSTPSHRPGRVQPSVAFNNSTSETATLIEIVAEDRPGLLYDLTRTFSDAGCNIEVILIDTEAHKALDVFYVTAAGNKLSEGLESTLRDELISACRG